MTISLADMVRWDCLDGRIKRGSVLSDADRADYAEILIKFLEDFAATDPEGYEKEYGDVEKTGSIGSPLVS